MKLKIAISIDEALVHKVEALDWNKKNRSQKIELIITKFFEPQEEGSATFRLDKLEQTVNASNAMLVKIVNAMQSGKVIELEYKPKRWWEFWK